MKYQNVNKKLIIILFLVTPFLSFAQGKSSNFELISLIVASMAVALIIGVVATFLNLNSTIIHNEAKRVGIEEKKETSSAWERWKKKMTDIVPIEKEADILLDHNYDGIEELDNTLPPWWLYGFYLSIVVSIFYIGYYHYYDIGLDSKEEYEYEMEEAETAVIAYLERQSNKIDISTLEALTESEDLAHGEKIFMNNCIACHLKGGGGSPNSVGPNLTDEYWLHGGDIKSVFKTVKYGVPKKGMIAWKAQLKPTDIHKVSSYIMSLQGTNPPNAKAPQGDKYIGMQAESK